MRLQVTGSSDLCFCPLLESRSHKNSATNGDSAVRKEEEGGRDTTFVEWTRRKGGMEELLSVDCVLRGQIHAVWFIRNTF